MNDIIETAQLIMKIGDEILKSVEKIEKMAIDKADAHGEYNLQLALKIVELSNCEAFEWRGKKYKKLPATLILQVAKGICFAEKVKKEKTDMLYKGLLSNINAKTAVMNGYQSINRHLDKVQK